MMFIISFSDENYITLTPAYDLLCSSIYDCDQRIAMKIGKAKYYKDVTEQDFQLFAKDIDISYKIVQKEMNRQKKLIVPILNKITQELECEIGNKILEYVKLTLEGSV